MKKIVMLILSTIIIFLLIACEKKSTESATLEVIQQNKELTEHTLENQDTLSNSLEVHNTTQADIDDIQKPPEVNSNDLPIELQEWLPEKYESLYQLSEVGFTVESSMNYEELRDHYKLKISEINLIEDVTLEEEKSFVYSGASEKGETYIIQIFEEKNNVVSVNVNIMPVGYSPYAN